MDYCTVANIESYYVNIDFTATSLVTETEVGTFISQESALIDSMISKLYSLPISDSTDLLILQKVCELYVVYTIDRIFREKDREESFNYKRDTKKEADKIMKRIMEGDIQLDSTQISSPITFNDVGYDGEAVEPFFQMSKANPYTFED